MASKMETMTKKVTNFKIFDPNSPDDKVAYELAILSHELWSNMHYPHQTNSIEFYKRRLALPWKIDQKMIYILIQSSSGESIGYCRLMFNTGKTNKHLCWTDFYIKPEYRRQGYFKALCLESFKQLPNYVKIYQFFFRVDENQKYPNEMTTLDAKLSSLADQLDSKLSFIGRRSEVDLTKHSLNDVSQKAKDLELKANRNGYSIVFVDDIAFKDLSFTRAQYVKLLEELDNDMPRDNNSQEDSTITEEDFLNMFKFDKKEELTEWLYIAVDNKTGIPIAMTETRIRADLPNIAYVGDTGVKREHRGKKLGLTLKYLMMQRLLSDPISKNKVKFWITHNAYSNKHMIAINDELGYVQSGLEHQYEFRIDKLKEFLEINNYQSE